MISDIIFHFGVFCEFLIRTTYRIYIFTKLNIFPKECALRCNEHLGIASTNMSTSLETEIVTFDYLREYMSSYMTCGHAL